MNITRLPMPQPNSATGTLSGLLLTLCLSTTVSASTALEGLPQAVQDEIATICLPVQYRQGASAYRNCVLQEISLRDGREDLLADLSFDDKYAVQQACAAAGRESAGAFRRCVSEQIAALNSEPEPDFSTLSEDERYALQQSCFDAQSREGAQAYRQCLNTGLQALAAVAPVDMSGLSLLDRNAAQLRCSARTQSAAAYRECLAEQPGVRQSNPATVAEAPVAGRIDAAAPESPASNTAPAEPEPPAVISDAADILTAESTSTATPVPQPQAEPAAEPVIEQTIEPQPTTAPAPDALQPANTSPAPAPSSPALSTDSGSADAPVVDSPEPATGAAGQAAAQVGDAPVDAGVNAGLDNTPDTEADATGEIASPTEATDFARLLESAAAAVTAYLTSARDTLVTLWQTNDWPARIAALGIPALLLTLLGWARARRRERRQQQHASGALSERLGHSMRIDRGELEALDELDQTAAPMARRDSRFNDAMPLFDDDDLAELDEALNLGPEADEPAIRREAALMAADEEATRYAEKPVARPAPATEQPADAVDAPAGLTPSLPEGEAPVGAAIRDFGPWLDSQDADERARLCIELLIYWIAYADDRYEPALRRELFQARELDEHDLIKRWALQNDSVAFAEAIGHLQHHLDPRQKLQTMDLLMTLLVTENAVTPVQNTLLRFLSDAFGIGRETLEERFLDAFGHPLANMPRPDKEAWWKKQASGTRLRWDARRVAELEQRARLAARLGIDPGSDETAIIAAFRRAARRCHPDRFDALSERERALAARQFGKFEEARDLLLGVSV